MGLFIVSNENGFLSDFKFDKKNEVINAVYTSNEDLALICYPRFEYVLKFNLKGFDFHSCKVKEVEFTENLTEQMKKCEELEKKSFQFKDDLIIERKVKDVNFVQSEIMKHQGVFIEFFNNCEFKQDGSIMKKYRDQYNALKDRVKCAFRWDFVGNNIWLYFSHNSVNENVYIILDDDREQSEKQYKKMTVAQYKKSIAKIKANEDKIRDLKSEISQLKIKNYL